ncbi:class A beta-lactamase-related serine hydrolase [Patescibacteria group bacterium]|nr:class A beta-lactamase-related serine hydrolase [Patescibacteria group bacterium]
MFTYTPILIEKRRRERARKKYLLLLLPAFIAFLGIISYKHFRKLPADLSLTNQVVLSAQTAPPSSPGLTTVIDSTLEGTSGTYGIVIKNLKAGEAYFQNEHRVFEPASLYKLWVMGAVFQQVEKGQLNQDEVLTADAADLNKEFAIAPEDAEQASGPVSYSVRDALNQMITISNNYAALLLTHRVGLSAISSFLATKGLTESKVGVGQASPLTTPADTALFLEKLYLGQLANPQNTSEMLSLLRWQKLNDGLPKYLPDDITVAHKTGEMEPFTHDAGIVYADSGDYLIVVFSETDSRPLAKERIALISKGVYDYFTATPSGSLTN